jgi:hypothetical protein
MKKRPRQKHEPKKAQNPLTLDSIPASEEWLYRNPEALASVRQGFADAAAGRTVYLGSFAKYAGASRSR